MFLDESGDHSLTHIDRAYPIFVLCEVVMDEAYHNSTASKFLAEMKQDLFGREDIVLHTAAFTRNHSGFEKMADHGFRTRFFASLERLVRNLEFRAVACVIKKQEHLAKYGLSAIDPYMLSLSIVVERFVFECGSAGGTIIAESRDETLNNALELAFLDLKIRGTSFVPASKIRKRIHNFGIHDKKESIAGLQVADILATPMGRHVLGKVTYSAYFEGGDFWNVIQPKIRRDWKGNIEGMGLVVLPK